MDQCHDMIKIEKEFGTITMGIEDSSKLKPTVRSSLNTKEPDPLWLKLSEVLKYNPTKFQKFKELVDQAQIDMELDYEKQRKKALDDFLMRKRTKGFTGDIQALIKQGSNQDAEQLKQDLCILKRQRDEN